MYDIYNMLAGEAEVMFGKLKVLATVAGYL